MRHTLHIRVAFEFCRLGHEHLQRAYELLVPIARRRVNPLSTEPEVADKRSQEIHTQGEETD